MKKRPMKILVVTDAWYPQVNGVVRTIASTNQQLEALGHEVHMLTPEFFTTLPCPTYPEIRLSLLPGSRASQMIRDIAPDTIHIATEGPLGLAARNYAMRHDLSFTTAYHTRFPEYVRSRIKIPLSWTYAFIRWFHGPSSAVLAPTDTVIKDLEHWRISNPVHWPRGVELDVFTMPKTRKKNKKPIFIYIGRVAVEKNIEAFLELDLPGEKWVVGSGPAEDDLRKKFPDVKFFGMKSKKELPAFYQQADVFVFPSKTDTFGLVLLESMACGLPVAAFPVTGPIDVIGNSGAGILSDDLQTACIQALDIPRPLARAHAESFGWPAATKLFEKHLVQCRPEDGYAMMDNPYKKNSGPVRAWHAFKNSLSGLRFALNEESAFRQELVLAIILVIIAIFAPVALLEKTLMISSVIVVLIVELLNSSVEAAVDRISLSKHGLSKRAKDYGSAAVLLSFLLAGGVYVSILGPIILSYVFGN